jgi:hypothetical protein
VSALLLGVMVGTIIALAICAPLFASWPTRLRWVVVAQAMDPFGGLPASFGIVLGEAVIVEVSVHDDRVEVTVAEGRAGSPVRQRHLDVHSTAPGLVAQLEGWCTVRLPLLLTFGESGEAQLAGPGATLAGFREASDHQHRSG